MSCEYCTNGINIKGDWTDLQIHKEDDEWWITALGDGRADLKLNYCPMCGTHLTEPKPLTLDELKQREGKPVWVKRINEECDICGDGWCVIDFWSGCVNVWWFGSEVEDTPNESDYGKTWLAYDREVRNDLTIGRINNAG